MPDLHLTLATEDGATEVLASPLEGQEAIAMLESAEITAAQLVPWGSNYTFAVGLTDCHGASHLGIYKPRAGERPLWDFDRGTLYRREYAAFLLSDWLGWSFVPPTVIRDGPHGPGSLQLYIAPSEDEVDEHEFWGRRLADIERMVLFDEIANNADRKIGHCLVDRTGRIWGIDHGLTFNVDPKLRTVLWQYSGEPISPPLLEDLTRIVDAGNELRERLSGVLSSAEIHALTMRSRSLLLSGRHQVLDPTYNIPYGWW